MKKTLIASALAVLTLGLLAAAPASAHENGPTYGRSAGRSYYGNAARSRSYGGGYYGGSYYGDRGVNAEVKIPRSPE